MIRAFIRERENPKELNKGRLSILLLLFSVTGIIIISQNFLLIPLSSPIQQTFHIQSRILFLGSSIFSLFYALGFLIWAMMIKKFGKRKILLIGLSLASVLTLGIGWVESYSWFCLLRGLQGLVCATFTPIALNYSLKLFRVKKLTFLSAIFTSSAILGQLIAHIAIQYVTLSQLFIVFGVVMGGLVVCFMGMLPSDEGENVHVKVTFEAKFLLNILLKTDNRMLFGITFLPFFYFVVGTHVTNELLMERELQVSRLSLQVISLVGMLLPFVWSSLCPKVFKNKIYFVTALIQFGFLLILFSSSTALYISIFLISFAISYLLPFLIQEIGYRNQENQAYAMAGYTFCLFLGSSIGGGVSAINCTSVILAIAEGTIVITYYNARARKKLRKTRDVLTG
ncbi:MFS transporter [Lysinibacillus fusiformis]|nr:hypothetical protein LSP_04620 [Lysinibacillus sphaericus]RDV27617.1 hypothetical protein C7B90_19370 [Lysinibacillus fusiformis]GED64050.1 MFS transporter [Lysinibacillus fusiformis]